MKQNEEIRSRLKKNYQKLSKGQKRLADYILKHWEEAAFLTAAQLGEKAGVSESTAVRFAGVLQYEGYPQFQKALAGVVQHSLRIRERSDDVYEHMPQNELLEYVLKTDMQRIEKTLQNMDGTSFMEALERIENARKIFVIGLRGSASMAGYLAFQLNMIYDQVIVLRSSSEQELLEQMLYISGKDVIIGISFPRYSMRTLKALEFASSRQASVITLTDSIHSPVNLYSSCTLTACTDMTSVVDSMVAPMSIINAMAAALCMKHKKRVMEHLALTEEILGNYAVAGNDELDYVEETVEWKKI